MASLSSRDCESPCDSLSPLDDIARDELKNHDMFADVRGFFHEERLWNAGTRELQTQQELPLACSESDAQPELATIQESTEECSPRSTLIKRNRRPPDLALTRTNGLTTVSTPNLRQCIRDAHADRDATSVQIPRPRPSHLPKTPATPSPLIVMGNLPSSVLDFPPDDHASVRGIARPPVRMLRKSSTNFLFNKRLDSKAPLPAKLMGTVIHVQQQPSATSFDEVDEFDQGHVDQAKASSQAIDEQRNGEPHHPALATTISNESTLQPPDVISTISESRIENHRELTPGSTTPCKQSKSESNLKQRVAIHHQLVLSPSIPAPSPLPEDTPHKYGLKDRIETPEVPERKVVNGVRARRRSSGREIFHDAKSLQSASSFLNGLSTSRRRAESAAKRHNKPIPRPAASHEPDTAPPSHSEPAQQNPYPSDRWHGDTFKPSGFAYARPLAVVQLKCYRNHGRLVPSGNKKAPVECAVCHIDDDSTHFSCSWCALRMCRFCRKDFGERGVLALKERIKQAELGSCGPEGSSDCLAGAEVGGVACG